MSFLCRADIVLLQYLKSLGAKYTLDYHSDSVISKIKEITKDNLQLAIECVGIADNKVTEAFSSKGKPKLAHVSVAPKNVPSHVQAFKVWSGQVFTDDECKQWFYKLWDKFMPLFEKGKLIPSPVEPLSGLEGILEGVKKLRQGKISAKKQVGILAASEFLSSEAL